MLLKKLRCDNSGSDVTFTTCTYTHVCVHTTRTFISTYVRPIHYVTGLTMYSTEYQYTNEKLSKKLNISYSNNFDDERR